MNDLFLCKNVKQDISFKSML